MLFARRSVPWGISLVMVLVIGCAQPGRPGTAVRGDERIAQADANALYVQLTAAHKDARAARERVEVANQQLRRHIERLAAARDSSQTPHPSASGSKTMRTADTTPQKRVIGSDATAASPAGKATTSGKPKSTRPPVK